MKTQKSKLFLSRIPLLLIIPFCCILSVLHLSAKPAHAQSLSLSISPPILEVMIKPGKSITQAYKLINNGETTIITPRLVEFGNNNQVINNADFQKEEWISLLNTDIAFDKPFLLPSGAEKQILLRLNPPKDTKEQDYYRVLLFSTSPSTPQESSQSNLTQNIGSILAINVTFSGLPARGAQITKFDVAKILDSFGPLQINIDMKNTGKTYFRPNGDIRLQGPIGKGSYTIDPNLYLTGQTRRITTDVSFPKKTYAPFNQSTTVFLPGFYLGKYKVDIDLVIGENAIRIETSKVFYAVPWKASLGVCIAIIILYLLKKRKKKLAGQKKAKKE